MKLEESAGGAVVATLDGIPKVLLIRVRSTGFELPKGHVEAGELKTETAMREICEETNILTDIAPGMDIGHLSYVFERGNGNIKKTVTYFLFTVASNQTVSFGPRPKRTREVRWVSESDIDKISLVNDGLLPIIQNAFENYRV